MPFLFFFPIVVNRESHCPFHPTNTRRDWQVPGKDQKRRIPFFQHASLFNSVASMRFFLLVVPLLLGFVTADLQPPPRVIVSKPTAPAEMHDIQERAVRLQLRSASGEGSSSRDGLKQGTGRGTRYPNPPSMLPTLFKTKHPHTAETAPVGYPAESLAPIALSRPRGAGGFQYPSAPGAERARTAADGALVPSKSPSGSGSKRKSKYDLDQFSTPFIDSIIKVEGSSSGSRKQPNRYPRLETEPSKRSGPPRPRRAPTTLPRTHSGNTQPVIDFTPPTLESYAWSQPATNPAPTTVRATSPQSVSTFKLFGNTIQVPPRTSSSRSPSHSPSSHRSRRQKRMVNVITGLHEHGIQLEDYSPGRGDELSSPSPRPSSRVNRNRSLARE